jgi:hypothetical protein
MFLSSYSPLFGLLAYTNSETPWAWRILVAVAIVSVLGLVTVMWAKRNELGPRLTKAGWVHGDLESRIVSWRKGILRSHGSPEEVPR